MFETYLISKKITQDNNSWKYEIHRLQDQHQLRRALMLVTEVCFKDSTVQMYIDSYTTRVEKSTLSMSFPDFSIVKTPPEGRSLFEQKSY